MRRDVFGRQHAARTIARGVGDPRRAAVRTGNRHVPDGDDEPAEVVLRVTQLFVTAGVLKRESSSGGNHGIVLASVQNRVVERALSAAAGRELICPTGSHHKFLSSPSQKNISLRCLVKSALLIPSSRLDQRGVSRSSRTRGGMRWMLTACKTSTPEVDGEVVAS
jgi:hypothetical protein